MCNCKKVYNRKLSLNGRVNEFYEFYLNAKTKVYVEAHIAFFAQREMQLKLTFVICEEGGINNFGNGKEKNEIEFTKKREKSEREKKVTYAELKYQSKKEMFEKKIEIFFFIIFFSIF